MESTIFGVSVRALLALIVTVSGLGFLYLTGWLTSSLELLNIIVTAVISSVTLVLGFYMGQRQNPPAGE